MQRISIRKINNEEGETSPGHTVVFEGVAIMALTETLIAQFSPGGAYPDPAESRLIVPVLLEINRGRFKKQNTLTDFPLVGIVQEAGQLILSCTCNAGGDRLCGHQAAVLSVILKKDEIKAFFDEGLRYQRLKKFAAGYGMEQEPDLDNFFKIEYVSQRLVITPALPLLLPVNKEGMDKLKSVIALNLAPPDDGDSQLCLVLRQHKYYKYIFIELYKAQFTREGKVKNPLTAMPPLDFIWQTEDPNEIRFFTGVHKFQDYKNKAPGEADITALRAIVNNPSGYDFYYHDAELSENVTAASVVPVHISLLTAEPVISVTLKDQFYQLAGNIQIGQTTYELKDLAVWFTYFLKAGGQFYLVKSLQQLNVINFLTGKKDNMLVHASKFEEFKKELLVKLEEKVSVEYKHIQPASPAQLEEQGFNLETEKIIYLSDFGSYVMIIPVMRYSEVEISVRTKKQIYVIDNKGKEFLVRRNEPAEIEFTALLMKQHPYFEEQLNNDLNYFYLHRKRFLDENWFLTAFEEWQSHNITILGFNELESNRLNPNKVKITVRVLSGINWFNATVNARFGKSKASLKQIYRAVRNKTKYVQLDDGTQGILPAEWIEKFTKYFNAGDIAGDETLQIAKSNFGVIEQLFDEAMVDEKAMEEIGAYRKKLLDFKSVQTVAVPAAFNGVLRPYQQQGLEWLNFLDNFNFGGCLADDMGLGKTVQIIAFILALRDKVVSNTNLVVVPTSLIYNWQQETARFAPDMRVKTIYGADRIKSTGGFNQYEVILTSYGTLLADIVFLKDYVFNYVFLDESQQIKNPGSQRYKAAMLLKARSRIVLTGTPLENNTFDLYGQLSFACPGLLGSRQYFKELYSTPIDQFKSSKRAAELQSKISPFILRRTKKQVAADLPEKTETVLYCEMKPEQRAVYDAYEKEFREFISATDGEELRKKPMRVLKGITKLRQICCSPLLINGEKVHGSSSAKIETLLEELEGKIHEHKILVFSQFVALLNLVKKELLNRNIAHSYLTGQTRNRQAVIEGFQNDETLRVFLISLKAGGTGLNLTQADYVYLLDPWWNPAVENQAIDRCHRIGQDKSIVAVRLICPGTVEEKIMYLQETKRNLAGELIKADSPFIQTLTKADLLGLLG